jgi:hypothetical protein
MNFLKIITTNWINIAGVFLATFIYAVILNLLPNDVGRSYNILQAMLAALFLVCFYGLLAWLLLVIELIVLDLLLMVLMLRKEKNLKIILFIEWLAISAPFMYWTIKYNEWIFLVGILIFLITQMRREQLILKAKTK